MPGISQRTPGVSITSKAPGIFGALRESKRAVFGQILPQIELPVKPLFRN